MKRTRLCDLLGIDYPIIQAPMAWVATAELVAAVSEAGGLGTLGPNAGMTQQTEAGDIGASIACFREQISKVRELTKKPFAANLVVGWGKQRPISDVMVDVAIEEGVPVAVVSMGSPEAYTHKLKDGGVKVIHAVGTVGHAVKAQACGVDAVVCEGYEGAGHLGREELTTLVLVPQIADAVEIPVIAGGGIVDARGVVAAFALGAEGIYMGTRFLATLECIAHPSVKLAVVQAADNSTVAFARKTGLSRCLKNEYVRKHMEFEASGASFDELRDYERTCPNLKGWRRVPGALIAGNVEEGSVPVGAASGLIKEVTPAGEVIYSIVQDYDAIVRRLK